MRRLHMMERRALLVSALGAAALASHEAQAEGAAAQRAAAAPPPEPVVWPVVGKVRSGITSFAGYTDTVLDIVGRIGTPASLVIFTEGNHLMALLSDEIVGAFPAWAGSQSQHTDLDTDNVVVVTLPQPIVVEMVRTGTIALGNLTLDVTRASGCYPDIVLGGTAPLQQLRKLGVLEPQARFFSRNRGRALLVRKGNPLGISGLGDVARTGARLAQADTVEAAARAGNRAAIEGLIGKPAADAFFANEVSIFPAGSGLPIATYPRWWPAVTPTWGSRSIISFPIGRGRFQLFSSSCRSRERNGFRSRLRLAGSSTRCVGAPPGRSRNSSSARRGTSIPATISRAWPTTNTGRL